MRTKFGGIKALSIFRAVVMVLRCTSLGIGRRLGFTLIVIGSRSCLSFEIAIVGIAARLGTGGDVPFPATIKSWRKCFDVYVPRPVAVTNGEVERRLGNIGAG